LWKKYDPMKLASAQAFRDNPKLVWSWYNDTRRKIMAAVKKYVVDRQKE